MLLEKAQKILAQPVCDHCLGRQFAQLLHGYTNEERGKILRTIVAMSIDKSKEEKKEENSSAAFDMSNFSGFYFHNLEFDKNIRQKTCTVCNGFFGDTDKWLKKIEKACSKCEIKTFLVGTKLPFETIENEEALWERVGIDFCEPIKAEINREVGKLVEKKLKLRYDPKKPSANIIINLADNKIDVEINPLFIYGRYQKLKRGIPQTKWPSGKYKTSVEQIIAKPFMRATRAEAHKLHGCGREDIDARCLGWRPFVLELIKPKKRDINLSRLAKKIPAAVKVRNLRLSGIGEVRRIKEAKVDKTYRMTVKCEKKIGKSDLDKLKLIKAIRQRTPQRVLHRRSDRARRRTVRSVKARKINPREFELIVRCESGLYVKELVSGDDGRTEPSVSQILGANCSCTNLDVIKIHI